MNKREFIKVSSAMVTGLFLSPLLGCNGSRKEERYIYNWAGNYQYNTSNLLVPDGAADVKTMVTQNPKLKALGTRHCFNGIADSRHALLSTENLNQVKKLDAEKMTVTVGAGMKYGDLSAHLQKEGYALHNLASLPHISIAGACATATHGSGTGNLATAVVAFDMITADGQMVTISKEKDSEEFNGMVVGLGAFGIITTMTLRIEPSYMVRQDVYLDLPFTQLKDNFEAIMKSGYSVSLFTDWSEAKVNEVWIKSRVDNDRPFALTADFYGAVAATENVHPILGVSPENCTDQMGVPAPWNERLAHFKMGFTPSKGEEVQSEYFVPFERAAEAIDEIAQLSAEITPLLFMGEIRTISADDYWMSTAYRRNSVTFHFTWKPETEAVRKVLPKIEARLAKFDYRPHYAKLFTTPPEELRAKYEKYDAFKKLVLKYDPQGKFKNDFLATYIL
ncbi:FAD-binding protein [Parapedobacter sp. 10938]|uniref:FAD-binding protein n=1 Tax=Parapedobacter flavus TaxID=3110225 RepID=UPI002DC0371D|nr:FAD-binding protein [Parapedobacter sp. 10938]MEC3878416.1 FAD-binding protein [Parapedobacter sp. 10938]